MNDPPQSSWSWTGRNLIALAILLALLGGLIAWRVANNPGRIGDDLVVRPAPLALAEEKVDPNQATWPSLARLPAIGPGRAKAIIDYRQKFQAKHTGRAAFTCLADIENVPGIGPVIVEGIAPFLVFPTTQPATATGPA